MGVEKSASLLSVSPVLRQLGLWIFYEYLIMMIYILVYIYQSIGVTFSYIFMQILLYMWIDLLFKLNLL